MKNKKLKRYKKKANTDFTGTIEYPPFKITPDAWIKARDKSIPFWLTKHFLNIPHKIYWYGKVGKNEKKL